LKLTEVLSDVTGVTGRAIIRAILRGTRAPEKLAKHRDKGCKASEAEIAQALTGSYRQEHLFELRLAHEPWQFTLGQVKGREGQPDASGGEPGGAGAAGGSPGPAPQQGCVGRVPAADEGAAGGSGGPDRDGAQAGPDRLPGVEARDDVRAPGPGGVRGADEGE